MGVIDFAEYLKSVIQAGQSIEGNVVKMFADNGDEIGDVVFKVIQGGNGTANEVGVAVTAGAGGTTTTTGLAFMAIDVGVAGAAIAPALGVLAGVGLYNLAPEFWSNVSNALVDAGQTVGGKIIAYWDGDNVNFSEETIEIFKNALINEGVFIQTPEYILPDQSPLFYPNSYSNVNFFKVLSSGTFVNNPVYYPDRITLYDFNTPSISELYTGVVVTRDNNFTPIAFALEPFSVYFRRRNSSGTLIDNVGGSSVAVTKNNITYYIWRLSYGYNATSLNTNDCKANTNRAGIINEDVWDIAYITLNGELMPDNTENLQPDATLPDENPFPLIYPDWTPWAYPITIPDPSELPTVYPVKYPETEPNPYPTQEPAQNPDPEPAPVIIPVINPNFPLPEPGIVPEPEPVPDPDPQPEPEPIPEPEPGTPSPDPSNPNPDPTPSPIVPVVPLPSTVSSNKLFTVYNPTSAELDALGAYLWDSSIMASIRDIWQNPLDGIISLIQVYATPAVSGSHDIILGFLDSGVNSAVVSSQFVTIDCGSVTVPEDKKNATDYAPYTSLHLYLPFIGIVELDTNECMKSSINVKYKVDVYTGTCLATVSITRSEDMPNAPILYTYSGNCSQQIPLTSGNATGMLTALIGGITAGLSVASGGGLGVLAGATIAGQSLTHEMFHVSHSGNISANAGIMGQKKPYLIIGRRHGYDANNYNAIYGYPANKTVVLGNHTGYVKVKKCFLQTSATQPEHNRIMELLTDGVIL